MVILQSSDIVKLFIDKKQRLCRYNRLLSLSLQTFAVFFRQGEQVRQSIQVCSASDLFTNPVAYKCSIFEHALYPYNKVLTVVLIHV